MKKSLSAANITKFILLLLLLATFFILARYTSLDQLLSIDYLQSLKDKYGIWSHLFFFVFCIVSTVTFLPPLFLSVAAGVIFGKFLGFTYIVLGFTIGSMISFALARFLGKSFIEGLMSRYLKQVMKYDQKLQDKGLLTIFILRLIPIFHFNFFNYALGLTKVTWKDYFWGTFLGVMPGTLVIVVFSHSVASANAVDIVVSLVLGIVLLVAFYLVYKKYLKKDKKQKKDPLRPIK